MRQFLVLNSLLHTAWEKHLELAESERHSKKGFGPLFFLCHAAAFSGTRLIKKRGEGSRE
jgi:hypothetical protein